MTITIRRFVATLVVGTIALTACGGSTATPRAGFTGTPKIPAAILLSKEQGEKITRNVTPIQTTSPTPLETGDVISVGGEPEREQGPAGDPVSTPLSEPPAAGFYAHRITVSGGFNFTGEFDVQFHEPESISGGRRQRQEWKIQGAPQEFTYEWRGTQLLLTYAKQTGPDGTSYECRFDPPRLELRLPMRVGESWTATTKCGDVTETLEAEIVRTEQIHVGGIPVDTFVIRSTIESSDGENESTSKVTSWYAPEQRLFARVDSVIESNGQTLKTFVDLLALEPREE